MMSQEGIINVDKQLKHDMDDYEAIKSMTHGVVLENTHSMTMITVWKSQIRNTLV